MRPVTRVEATAGSREGSVTIDSPRQKESKRLKLFCYSGNRKEGR